VITPLPFAVHIGPGVLTWPWLAAGFVGMAVLVLWGGWHVPDERIPLVGLLTAVFFVASQIHVPVPGGAGKVHLLLNGLVGILLGRCAGVAIPVGLFLQALMFSHGGLDALGVNSCVMAIPAIAAWGLYGGLRRLPGLRWPWPRGLLVAFAVGLWLWCLLFSVEDVLRRNLGSGEPDRLALQPLPLLAIAGLAGLAALVERRMENRPEFALGLLVGEFAVLLTVALNALVLRGSGADDWQTLANLVFLAHLPIAAIEGVVLGFVVGFLAQVRPDLLRTETPPGGGSPGG
jgi:cobalt/nickel transport system permease protein